MVVNPNNTFYATKRLIGRRFKDTETANFAKQVSYKVSASPKGDAWVEDETGRKYSPSQIASETLIKLKQVSPQTGSPLLLNSYRRWLKKPSVRRSRERSSPYRPTSIIFNVRQRKMPEGSLVWKSRESLTSRLPQVFNSCSLSWPHYSSRLRNQSRWRQNNRCIWSRRRNIWCLYFNSGWRGFWS